MTIWCGEASIEACGGEATQVANLILFVEQWCPRHEVSILIAAAVARYFGSQPRAKVSMTIMRPPQQGHGRGSTRGSSIAALGVSGSFGQGGTASRLRVCAMFAARLPLAISP